MAGLAVWVAGVELAAGTTYIGASGTAGATDTWNIAGRWDLGVPSGAVNAVIDPGKYVVVNAATPAYSGNLSLGAGSTLQIGWTTSVPTAYNALGNAASTTITLAAGSQLRFRNGGTVNMPAINLTGNATLALGESTQTPAVVNFNNPITGAFTFNIDSNGQGSNPLASFNVANGFSAIVLRDITGRGNPADTFRANAAGSLGTGDVTINPVRPDGRAPGLVIQAANSIADSGNLRINGLGPTAAGTNRLTMNASDTVGSLWLNGVKQIGGNYTAAGLGAGWMAGAATLTVDGPAFAYWDLNGATAGSGSATPSGTWNSSNTFWNNAAAGTGATSAWTPGQTASFSAGADATGSYAISVVGTQDIGAMNFPLGTVSFSGGGLRLVTDSPVYVASGASAIIDTPLSEDAGGRGLHKNGPGTLVLSGNNSYTGVTGISGGVLELAGSNSFTGDTLLAAGALRLSNTGAIASSSALRMFGGSTLRLAQDSAASFSGPAIELTQNGNVTINVDNNGSGSGNVLTYGGGLNKRTSVGSGNVNSTLTVTGANGYSLSLPSVNLTGGNSLTFAPTSASLAVGAITATTGTTGFGPANNINLILGGNPGTVNSITSITETSNAAQQLILNKNTAAQWTLGNVDLKQGNASVVSAGDLILNGTLQFGIGTTLRQFTVSGGTLHYNNPAAVRTISTITTPVTTGAHLTYNGGSLDNTSGAAITTSTHNPNLMLNGGLTFVGSLGAASDLNFGTGPVSLGSVAGTTRTLTVQNADATLTLGGAISNGTTANALTKAGPGILRLSGASTYTGPTTVSGGVLSIASIANGGLSSPIGASPAAAGNLVLGGGTLRYTGASGSSNRGFTLSSGSAGTFEITSAAATLTLSGGSAATTGDLVKAGPGTLVLAAASNYTGITRINEGRLRLGAPGGVPDEERMEFAAGAGLATFDLGGFDQRLSQITDVGVSGNARIDNTSASPATLTLRSTAASSVFNGQIHNTGGGALTVEVGYVNPTPNAVSLTLGGAGGNTFTGPMRIQPNGTLVVTTGQESSLGAATGPNALTLNGGTLQVSNQSLVINDAGRQVRVDAGNNTSFSGGTFNVDGGLSLTIANTVEASGVSLRKTGTGALNLTGVTEAGTFSQLDGVTDISGGTLRVNALNLSGGTFNWGTGRLTFDTPIGQDDNVDYTSPGYTKVSPGNRVDISGDLSTGTGSVLVAHGSPTFYLNNGVRFNQYTITGDLDLSAAGDALEVEIIPYLLRPYSPSLGTNAVEYGSVPLVEVTGTLTGAFDTFGTVLPDGRGFDPFMGIFVDAASLPINTYYLEYRTGAGAGIFFHYKVNGYVPEPDSFTLCAGGALLLRALRRRRMSASR